MTTMRAMVILNMTSALPEDACVNTWHFYGDPTPGVLAGISTALGSFYDAISGSLAKHISFPLSRIKFYDLAHPKPRSPIHDTALVAGTSPSGNPLPHEVAMCLSFQGLRISGINQARRRGRVYLGPLAASTMTSEGILAAFDVDVVRDAAQTLLTASDATPDWSWCVYSTASDPDAPAIVQNGWVDDAFDIQRRRGVKATTRLTFSAP